MVAFAIQQRFNLDRALVQLAQQLGLTHLGHPQVLSLNVRIANNLHLGNLIDQLSGHLKQRAGEIAGDSPIAPSPFEVLDKEALIQRMGA